MTKFILLPFLVVAVTMVESHSVFHYPSAAVVNGYPVIAPVSSGFRSTLGPFFGYFPDMFSSPCPVCEAPPVAKDEITKCEAGSSVAVSDMSASPSGTIKMTAPSGTLNCGYALMTTPGYKSIVISCATFGERLTITPAPSGYNGASPNVPINIGSQAYLNFVTGASKDINCSWTAEKA